MSVGLRQMQSRAQRGDTIIEVLIAVAIVSVILAGAYAITNRNLSITQDTSERNQAQQLVQKQIEMLRSYASDTKNPPVPSNNCLYQDGSGAVTPIVDSSDQCSIPYSGATCGESFCFLLTMHPTGATTTAGGPVYEVTASWDGLGGSKSAVTMDYGPTS